ncbi:hypothetical protein CVT26_014556 [Gymnopilus dilepis]|uniref:Uncharacterized protein n=1 Tax=Gymnopilus dilepis TaxID=231916 RepID=A0A409VVJ9_9AGAR|nr:hypothetical protein CVT26_014556 [Gymnopilus dilepis]
MTESPDTPADIPHTLTGEELEPGLLYAVLSYRGELASWNWAFFLPNPAVRPIGTSGTMFHVVDTDSAGLWKFEVESKDVISSPLVVAILRLANVSFLGDYDDVVGDDSLLQMFKTVAIPEQASTEFSSRTWFIEAICVLHDCGVVQCDDAWLLEREIRRCAFTAMDRYLENKGADGFDVGRLIEQSTVRDNCHSQPPPTPTQILFDPNLKVVTVSYADQPHKATPLPPRTTSYDASITGHQHISIDGHHPPDLTASSRSSDACSGARSDVYGVHGLEGVKSW